MLKKRNIGERIVNIIAFTQNLQETDFTKNIFVSHPLFADVTAQ